jgi:hypothetical protein
MTHSQALAPADELASISSIDWLPHGVRGEREATPKSENALSPPEKGGKGQIDAADGETPVRFRRN